MPNTRYRALIEFGVLDPEQFASDDAIKEHLEGLGLVSVDVVGEGRERWAFGTWLGEEQDVDLPDVVKEVVVIGAAP